MVTIVLSPAPEYGTSPAISCPITPVKGLIGEDIKPVKEPRITRPTAKVRSARSCLAIRSPKGTNKMTVEIIEPTHPNRAVANT